MLLRAVDRAGSADAFPYVQQAFETIGFGKVSTSGPHAQQLGYLRDVDHVTMNRERVMAEAKARALSRVARRLRAACARGPRFRVGGATICWRRSRSACTWRIVRDGSAITTRSSVASWRGFSPAASVPHATTVSEDYLLDLEREAFLSLCGEPKTQERIAYTLKTGKTLRN